LSPIATIRRLREGPALWPAATAGCREGR
jgi:hypothetical protein